MDNKQPDMNDPGVWDDSALIDSWNEALNEYKKYHSIHARGGDIRDLELEQASKDASSPAKVKMEAAQQDEAAADEAQPAPVSNEAQVNHGSSMPAPMFPPQAVLGSMRDEGLKKLLMSWYYAGYYTGLFEGQQQGQAPAPAETQTQAQQPPS